VESVRNPYRKAALSIMSQIVTTDVMSCCTPNYEVIETSGLASTIH